MAPSGSAAPPLESIGFAQVGHFSMPMKNSPKGRVWSHAPHDEQNHFCVIKGTTHVPLHAHVDTEDFLVMSGAVEGLRHTADGHEWLEARAGWRLQ